MKRDSWLKKNGMVNKFGNFLVYMFFLVVFGKWIIYKFV